MNPKDQYIDKALELAEQRVFGDYSALVRTVALLAKEQRTSPIMTVAEACEYCKCSRGLLESKAFPAPCFRKGKKKFYLQTDLDQWLLERPEFVAPKGYRYSVSGKLCSAAKRATAQRLENIRQEIKQERKQHR